MLAGARVWQEVELCEHKDLLEAGGLQTFLSCPVTFLVMKLLVWFCGWVNFLTCPVTFLVMESIMIIAENIRLLSHVIQRLYCLSESRAMDVYLGLGELNGSDYYQMIFDISNDKWKLQLLTMAKGESAPFLRVTTHGERYIFIFNQLFSW